MTRTNGPLTHTSDDSYMYQLSLVVAIASISLPIVLYGHYGYGIIMCEGVHRVLTGGWKCYVLVCFCEINDGAGKDMFCDGVPMSAFLNACSVETPTY